MSKQRHRIFITGATGFIGKHVLHKLLLLQRYEIFVLSRRLSGAYGGVSYVKGNLEDVELLRDVISHADYIVHLAGCKKDPICCHSTNVLGTQNIVSACLHSGIQRLIYLSSVGVIGPSRETFIDERTTCNPGNAYEHSKLQAEYAVREFSRKHPEKTVILRPSNVFGEDDPELHLLNLIKKVQHHRFFYVGSHLSNYYLNYLYVKEISELIASFLDLAKPGGMYILNTPIPLQQFISDIKDILNDRSPVRYLPFWPTRFAALCFDLIPTSIMNHPPINSSKFRELCNTKRYSSALLEREIQWKPNYSMHEALSNLIAHYRQKGYLY